MPHFTASSSLNLDWIDKLNSVAQASLGSRHIWGSMHSLLLHGLTHKSTVNGPGRRVVIHTQGCKLACPGCFNPLSHASTGGTRWDLPELMAEILKEGAEGITISGGEPTEQLESIIELCRMVKAHGLSILLFSGLTLAEIQGLEGGPALLALLDVLIDGRYHHHEPALDGLRGSINQQIHLLSQRYQPKDLQMRRVEVQISPDGQVRMSGFPEPDFAQKLRRRLEV